MIAAPASCLRIGFALAPRFTRSAFADVVDVLRLARDGGHRSRPIRCRSRDLAATMHPVPSSTGLTIQPDQRLGDPRRFDYIVVVGGLIDEVARLHPDAVSFLRDAAAAQVPLVGICTGAFILPRAGLMDGYRC